MNEQAKAGKSTGRRRVGLDLAFGTSAVLALTGAGLVVQEWTGYWSMALLYLALVVFLATRLSRPAILGVAVLTGLLWNYLFIPPRFTLRIAHLNDALMFGMYLFVALAMGHLTSRLRAREEEERRGERRTRALYRLAQCLIESQTIDEALRLAVRETGEIFQGQAAVVLAAEDGRLDEAGHPASAWALGERDRAIAMWCHTEGDRAGRFTRNLPQGDATFVPLSTASRRAGVLGLRVSDGRELQEEDLDLLGAVADHIGAIVQRYDLARQAARARLVEESQRLYRTLFSSISHELKTPLAVIDSAATELRTAVRGASGAAAFVSDIESASLRLRGVVDSLLAMSRIESGRLDSTPGWCEVDELVEVVKDRAGGALAKHPFTADVPADLPAVFVDSGLLEHAVANLVTNAAQYSGEGAPILLRARVDGGALSIEVADRGPGIPADAVGHVFEKFFRGPNARPGGTGLGLAIVQGLMRALGGTASAANRPDGGAVFTLTVPVKTARLSEEEA